MGVNGRNSVIDIIRGILIILMVIGHSGSPIYLERFIYLFHLSAFMILSGYCYNDDNNRNYEVIKKYVGRKIKKMYIPYLVANGCFILLHNIFVKLYIYDNIYSIEDIALKILKNFFFMGAEQILGALWYLRVLFIVSILWSLVSYFARTVEYNIGVSNWSIRGGVCGMYAYNWIFSKYI